MNVYPELGVKSCRARRACNPSLKIVIKKIQPQHFSCHINVEKDTPLYLISFFSSSSSLFELLSHLSFEDLPGNSNVKSGGKVDKTSLFKFFFLKKDSARIRQESQKSKQLNVTKLRHQTYIKYIHAGKSDTFFFYRIYEHSQNDIKKRKAYL